MKHKNLIPQSTIDEVNQKNTSKRDLFSLRIDDGTKEQACSLIANYLQHAHKHGCDALRDWFRTFDFNSREDIARAYERFLFTFDTSDYVFGIRTIKEENRTIEQRNICTLYSRYHKLRTGKQDSECKVMSTELWQSYFAPKKRDERLQAVRDYPKQTAVYKQAVDHLQKIYPDFTDEVIEKMRYFVCQVITSNPDASLTKMLYIQGRNKTGKTTIAKMIVSALNNEPSFTNAGMYETKLKDEMGINRFSLPLVYRCAVAWMDECFYKDMSRTYADFKAMMTSSGGRYEVKFGNSDNEWKGFRNYVATSNDDISCFIKDFQDRRFLVIEMDNEPKEDYSQRPEELYQIWRDFVLNCEPPKNKTMFQWYNTFEMVTGEKQDEVNDIADMLTSNKFMNHVTCEITTRNVDGTKPHTRSALVPISFFKNFLQSQCAYRCDDRTALRKAVEQVFGLSIYDTQKNAKNRNILWSIMEISQKLARLGLMDR